MKVRLDVARCAAAAQVRAQIRKVFTNMGFQEMPSNAFVESRRAPVTSTAQQHLSCLLLRA